MQAVERNNDLVAAPRVYRNRPQPLAFPSPRQESLCDVVYVIDEDLNVRQEICGCIAALGIMVIPFASATDYLRFAGRDTAACLILDTHPPDISGFELQRRLSEKGNPPVVFISSHSDRESIVRAMKAGAVEFLTKPIDLHALVAAVRSALVQDRRLRHRKAELAELKKRFSSLTPRERDVLPLVVGGLLNKQAASVLGISEVTLQIHRSQVMRKTKAESFADLVRMAMKLHIPYWREGASSQNVQLGPTLPGAKSDFRARNVAQ